MPEYFECPHLGGHVELSDERRRHIAAARDLAVAELNALLARTLAEPDIIRQSATTANEWAFAKWREGFQRYLVVIVLTDSDDIVRHWIVSAWSARRLSRRSERWVIDS